MGRRSRTSPVALAAAALLRARRATRGAKGEPGVGVERVEFSPRVGGEVARVILTDGRVFETLLRHGRDGRTPADGVGVEDVRFVEADGGVRLALRLTSGAEYQSPTVRHGRDGYTPVRGRDFRDGTDGVGISAVSFVERDDEVFMRVVLTDGREALSPNLRGPMGPMPDHRWVGTALQFTRPGNRWGQLVDLKGNVLVRNVGVTREEVIGLLPSAAPREDAEQVTIEYVSSTDNRPSRIVVGDLHEIRYDWGVGDPHSFRYMGQAPIGTPTGDQSWSLVRTTLDAQGREVTRKKLVPVWAWDDRGGAPW